MYSIFGIRKMIKGIGINRKYYPKGYIMPGRKIRKLFRLKKQEIPKWAYCFVLYSFVYIAYFVIYSVMYLFVSEEDKYQIMVLAERSFYVICDFELIFSLLCRHKYKK